MSGLLSASAAVLAAFLYVLTYLTFVYMLRYPRNWIPPSAASATICGALFLLTVGVVSFSANGVDGFALVAMAILLPALLFVIAAPAIAFQPASKLTEYLAKHGGFAELLLLGPALLAAFLSTNAKFQSVVAVAVVIESAWFFRQRIRIQSRKTYKLDDADLKVLNTQATGDLIAFKQAHNIRELAVSSGDISWHGCGKQTLPCAFNLYVNRLGLNTAPCCRAHMKDLIDHVATGLTRIDAVHWLEGGTLLGAVRDNGTLLAWEDDVDISVLLSDELTWNQLSTALTKHGANDGFFVDLFERQGLISISYDPPRPWPFRWERNRMRGEIRADIAVYRPAISNGEKVLERRSKKGAMPKTESGSFGLPESVVLPTKPVGLVGRSYAGPNKPEAYLQTLYGDFHKVEYTYVDPIAAELRAGVSGGANADVSRS